MPPEEEPQPTPEARAALLELLNPILHEAVRNSSEHARSPIRRMNRFQYNNAVTDLFDLRCIVFTLPERTMRIHKGYFNRKPEKCRKRSRLEIARSANHK